MKRLSSYNLEVPQLTPEEAAALVRDVDTITICGAGGGITEPSELIMAQMYRTVAAEQPQLYGVPVNRFMSGDYTTDLALVDPLPLTERKVTARRALLEVQPGFVGNVEVG